MRVPWKMEPLERWFRIYMPIIAVIDIILIILAFWAVGHFLIKYW